MKVILNKDLSTLGEEGDVKDVARGYARNYLFPRGIALPYTPKTVKLFEARKEEIEAKKAQKRQDALGLKERLENLELSLTMPAGPNGKLYGAVTSQTVADELTKQGFQVDRKRIDLAGAGIKNVGKYKAVIKLYENSHAEIQITIIGQEIKTETHHAPARPVRRRRDGFGGAQGDAAPAGAEAPAEGEAPAAEQPALPPEPVAAPETAAVPEASAASEPAAATETTA
ncbi:MAG: 50S ribosomal protein L9 [Treponema sp.]|jgi:large subunit ribosomal protein L9|nr:50S ribosomal protein L9 [Treponema sp.]